jgi:hypothetical protein
MASKILSLSHVRRVGLISLGPLLDTLGLKLIAVSDEEALERNRSRYKPRDDPHFRSASAPRKPRPVTFKTVKKISGTISARMGHW